MAQLVVGHGIQLAYFSTNRTRDRRVGLHRARLPRFLGCGEGGFDLRGCTSVYIRLHFLAGAATSRGFELMKPS
jgi:hypothetical protein